MWPVRLGLGRLQIGCSIVVKNSEITQKEKGHSARTSLSARISGGEAQNRTEDTRIFSIPVTCSGEFSLYLEMSIPPPFDPLSTRSDSLRFSGFFDHFSGTITQELHKKFGSKSLPGATSIFRSNVDRKLPVQVFPLPRHSGFYARSSQPEQPTGAPRAVPERRTVP